MMASAAKTPNPGRAPNARRALRRVVAISVTLCGLAYVGFALFENWEQLRQVRLQWCLEWLVLHIMGVAAFFAFLPVVWSRVVRCCGVRCPTTAAIVSGYLPNLYKYVPGKIWAVASRVELLASLTGTSRPRSTAATGLAYLMETASAAGYLLVVAWLMPGSPLNGVWTGVVLVPALLLLCVPRVWVRALSALLARLRRDAPPVDLAAGGLPLTALLYVLQWLFYALAGVALARAFGATDPSVLFLTGCTFVASWLIGFVSLLTPGGIGVREGTMVFLLTPLLGSGEAAALSIISRFTWTLCEAVSAGAALYVLRRHVHRPCTPRAAATPANNGKTGGTIA